MLKKPGLDRDDIIQFAPKTLAFRKGEGNIPGKDGIFPKKDGIFLNFFGNTTCNSGFHPV